MPASDVVAPSICCYMPLPCLLLGRTSARQIPTLTSWSPAAAAGTFLQARRLSGYGGKGGTLNNLGLVISTKSSAIAGSTADRIRAIDAHARHYDHLDAAQYVASTPTADELLQQQPNRRLAGKSKLQRVLLQGGLGGLGGGLGGGGGSGGSSPRDITSGIEKRKQEAAVSSMISQAVNGDMDVMSAVTARQQGNLRAWEMSLGRDVQQQIQNGNLSGR
jgi:hypothetical protein